MKAVVFTLGCKVNEVESASIMAELEKRGFETDDKLGYADIYVLNTCAVTREAERKSRQLISRVKKFNPNALIYVCGCASQKDKSQFERADVKFVCGARAKQEVVNAVAADFGGQSCQELCFPKQVKTRAFIKIEDGCNNFCSYCVIPYLRGRVSSRPVEDIVAEVRACTAPEIVLTGINISAYKSGGAGLAELIDALAFTDKRVRLGSIECNVIDEKLLSALKKLADFAPQFHLSLQSGSNAVLRAMNRHYTREEYLGKCRLIYAHFPDAAITTDIIAGFCGESEEDFQDSLKIIEEAGFSRVHAFAFSPREGTKAFGMKDVDGAVKSDRLHRLIKAGKEAEEKYIKTRLGREYAVISEDFDGEFTCGYTQGYIKVYMRGEVSGKVNVVLEQPFRDGVTARVV
ncbi:MAG: tRNA (N(6)-L-threonylcarbamoyladenosine(37)-C(2))-methylthiotransferase MtaB [Clostridia bacterium]|nr:tRNA (N(6)-L-threonylcarbamoyladenosine(37)-C(2))-methylthiotransferase MtaB [Clostridia bacterium]